MIYESTDVPFRYPTPVSPQRELASDHCGPGLPEQPFPLLTPQQEQPPNRGPLSYDTQTNGYTQGYNDSRRPRSPLQARTNVIQHLHQPHEAGNRVHGVPPDRNEDHQHPKVIVPPSSAPHPCDDINATASGFQVNTPKKQRIIPSTPRSAPPKPFPGFSIQVPQLPPSSDPSQYVRLPHLDANVISEQHQSKKRKRDSEDERSLDDDREAEADVSVEILQRLLMEAFEAEDQLAPDTSGIASQAAQQYFLSSSLQDGRQSCLEAEVLTRLDSALLKVIRGHRIADIHGEQLVHAQRLCAASFGLVQSERLDVPVDTSDKALDAWAQRLKYAVNGLKAAKPLLRTMSCAPGEKKLHSNDYVQELLDLLRQVIDQVIVPLIEKRATADDIEAFRLRPDTMEDVKLLSHQAGLVLKLLGNLVLEAELSETSVNSLEFLATSLLFVESASKEKESVLGIQKVENLRRVAMDTTAKIFLRHPDQRRPIFDEVLSSLEKLPVARQSARQYRLAGAKSIQLVSALIMQLIQTSASRSLQEHYERRHVDDSEADDSSDEESTSGDEPTRKKRPNKRRSTDKTDNDATARDRLSIVARPLIDAANNDATYVIHYLVRRAVTSSKTGDQPYRNLLDIFTEDFLNVLENPAWPAAELLLRALLSSLFSILDNSKAAVPAKNMSLDLLGLIGATVADLRASVTKAAESPETASEVDNSSLQTLCEDSLSTSAMQSKLLEARGLFRIVHEHLQRGSVNDLQLKSASSYYLASWAHWLFADKETQSRDLDQAFGWLLNALSQPDRVSDQRVTESISEATAKLCHTIILLNLPTCRAFGKILNVLLSALSSPQPNLRSRSLKSVIQLIENTPLILDQSATIMTQILRCTQDTSPLVRDSALGLVAKCAALRPTLEAKAGACFIDRSVDPAVGVRKRSVKHLRDLYLRSTSRDIRAAIADAILARLNDIEESVSDLARQTVEEIWLTPYHKLCTGDSVALQHRKDLEQHAFLVTATAKRGPEATTVLETLFKDALRQSCKKAKVNRDVCQVIVRLLFDYIIDNDQTTGHPSQKDCLHALTIFAKADPQLYSADQMITLRPYLENLATRDDLEVFRSTLVIYSRVLPVLPPMQKSFLFDIQDILFKAVTKLGKAELEEAAKCLWIIDGVVNNTERLVNLLLSVVRNIDGMREKVGPQKADVGRLCRLLDLAGHFGKACKLEDQLAAFHRGLPGWKFTTVSGMIVEVMLSCLSENSAAQIQETALAAIGLVCQAWPKGYQKAQVSKAFKAALEGNERNLQTIVLEDLRSFYLDEDTRSKAEAGDTSAKATDNGTEGLAKSMVSTDTDGAATAIAHQFLPSVLAIALSRIDDLALAAADILTSISRQGLMHPKEVIVALVALETSPNPLIAKIALDEHRDLHSKYESMLDREYLAAVDQAFVYQKDTAKQPSGVFTTGSPKLGPLYEVFKTGSVTARKKLLAGLCQRIEAQAAKSLVDLDYARFTSHNLGLLEYSRIDEVLHVISAIEKIMNTTGNTFYQQVEAELQRQVNGNDGEEQATLQQQPSLGSPALDRLVPAVIVISMLLRIRQHLKSVWDLQSLRSGSGKVAAKDATRPPVRAASVTNEDFLLELNDLLAATQSPEAVYARCKRFVEVMSIDNEAKATSEEETNNEGRHATPSEHGTEGSHRASVPLSGQRGRKKSTTASATPTPTKAGKKRGRPPVTGRRRSSKGTASKDDEDDDYE